MSRQNPKVVASVAALRALVHHDKDDWAVAGSSRGEYWFDQASTSSDDGDLVVKPSNVAVAEPGRWIKSVAASPSVGAFEILFTRKALKDSTADGSPVDTGLTYDPEYEYLLFSGERYAPTPDLTPAASLVGCWTSSALSVVYKPDGVNPNTGTGGSDWALISAAQNVSMLQGEGWKVGYQARITVNSAGKFYHQWLGSSNVDGHFCIARRRRYG